MPISLVWGQKVAAYWSISWPGWLLNFIVVFLLADLLPGGLRSHQIAASVVGIFAFVTAQGAAMGRLVSKDYRSFRIEVVRGGTERNRSLERGERLLVWLPIVGVELAFQTALVLLNFGSHAWATFFRSSAAVPALLRFLVFGPYAVGLALGIRYPGFVLQASRK